MVATTANLYTLSTESLTAVGGPLSNGPLAAGDGFARATPALSGALLFIQRDGAVDRPPRHLVTSIDEPRLSARFSEGTNGPGPGYGQAALSRGYAVYGSATGVFAYGTVDMTEPEVDLLSPPAGPHAARQHPSRRAGVRRARHRAGQLPCAHRQGSGPDARPGD